MTQVVSLFSAPEEKYLDHIQKCDQKFNLVFPIFYPTLLRIFGNDSSIIQGNLKKSFLKMILFHDLGKLTKRWQERVGSGKSLPSHSTLGASYIWNILPNSIKEPLSFAVSIHHTDRGLLGDNIERPDVQAILDGIVNNNGNINWHDDIKNLSKEYFPEDVYEIKVHSLKDMARGLRIWAKGCSLLEQHKRRLQASLAHHILKLCDISAAAERKEYEKKNEKDYYGGWLMVDNIKKYVDSIIERANL